jgi:hypothetical protein
MRAAPKMQGVAVAVGSFLFLCFLVAGCGGPDLGKMVPVSGKVTLDGKALSGAMITFVPDDSKGNKLKVTPFATADADGNYSLTTTPPKSETARDGAPVGWYKVQVVSGMPAGVPEKGVLPAKLPAQYTKAATSPIHMEVKEGGSYNLELKSR